MAAVYGNDARDMGTSESQQRCKFKRKRRRRCQKGRTNGLSTIINPVRHRDVGMTSVEEGHHSGPSGVEVKENRIQVDPEVPAIHHLAGCFCTNLPKGGTRALKRKQPLVDGKDRLLDQNQPKRACKRTAWAVGQKNALVQLNELRPGLRYEITSKTGPLHAPVFAIGVEVNGLRFEGRGTTKKQAKLRAAELALRSFVQFPNASQAYLAMGSFAGGHAVDFTADRLDVPGAFLKEFEPPLREKRDLVHLKPGRTELISGVCKRGQLVRLKLDLLSSTGLKRHLVGASLSEQLGPAALLNKLHPGLRYVCLTERLQGRPARSFVMVVRVLGQIFEGSGHSKMLAKAQAAAAALQALYHISLGMDRRLLGHSTGRDKSQLPQGFAEAIFHLVRDKYRQLTDSRCAASQGRHHKVLAGIVMTRGFDLHEAQVVALGSGTRCLSGDAVSHHGSTLNDCHAEVIARRALVRFLYSQLELALRKQPGDVHVDQSIFIPNKGSGYRLRDGVLFHMFVSSSPCGDARLNCPYELTATNAGSSHRLVRKFHCHLRMKIGGGEGTLPVTAAAAPRANQKCDVGALPGRPRHAVAMSCTDKIARWNVVGLQGALLSGLVGPVYLCSLTVGTLCHSGHLARAMARRLRHVAHLPFPYKRNRMLLGCLSSGEARLSGRSPALSGNWSCGDSGLEEVSTSTGRRADSGTPSRLCKRSLFTRWQGLKLNREASDTEDGTIRTYSGSKMASRSYQRARQQFAVALRDGGLGVWTRKPTELDQFTVTV